MIISHRHKFAFFRVPKTGSYTAEVVLRLSNAFDAKDLLSPMTGMPSTIPSSLYKPFHDARVKKVLQSPGAQKPDFDIRLVDKNISTYLSHITPQQAVQNNFITLEQLRTYKCFAFLRDPYERHLSAYIYLVGQGASSNNYKQLMKQGKLTSKHMAMRTSTEYFMYQNEQVCEPLHFTAYTNELNKAIADIGGYSFSEIPRLNTSQKQSGYDYSAFYDSETISWLNTEYANDIAFYQTYHKDWKPK